jgi:hypothetical protein
MKCPYFSGEYMFRCEVEEKLYVPTNLQLMEYCTTKKYKICPFFVFLSDKNSSEMRDFITIP